MKIILKDFIQVLCWNLQNICLIEKKIILDIKDIDNPDKKSNETIIHKKIMPPKTSNSNYESYKDNHLWLLMKGL